jgi:hypothetical protein
VGDVRLTAGVSPKLSDALDVIVKYASGVIVPPMFFGRRAALDTAGVPFGGVAVSVTLPVPEPVVVAGTCSVALGPPVIARLRVVGAFGEALNDWVDDPVPVEPPPP